MYRESKHSVELKAESALKQIQSAITALRSELNTATSQRNAKAVELEKTQRTEATGEYAASELDSRLTIFKKQAEALDSQIDSKSRRIRALEKAIE